MAPAALADEGLYLRIGAGVGTIDEDELTTIDFQNGYVGSVAVGYNRFFPQHVADLRVEVEGSARFNDINEINSGSANGDLQAFGAMVNGYFDLRTNLIVVPYVGAGFGALHVRLDHNAAGGAVVAIDDDDTVFAYQVMAGFTYNMGDNLGIGLDYRFMESDRFRVDNVASGTFTGRYNMHSVMLMVTLGF